MRTSYAMVVPAVLAIALFAPRARAEDVQTLTLTDGTTVTGEVIEFVAADHVTLKLPTGETRRVEWIELAAPAKAPDVEASSSPSWNHTDRAQLHGIPDYSLSRLLGNDDKTTVVDWREPDRTAPTIMPSRLSLGMQSGYGSRLGYLALAADYFPISSVGLATTVAMPIAGEPVTFGEMLLFE